MASRPVSRDATAALEPPLGHTAPNASATGRESREVRESARDVQLFTRRNVQVFFRSLLNTFRLASGPVEALRVLGIFFDAFQWRLQGSPAGRDGTLRLGGVTHVFGFGTGEMLTPQEIYVLGGYDRLPEFVPQRGWVVFDVGANAGVYAVQQARRGAAVYAFEPNPDCYRRLQRSIHLNAVQERVTPMNAALGAAAGAAELHVPGGRTTMGSLRSDGPDLQDGRSVPIQIRTVDGVMRDLGVTRVDLLKIDVEGLEVDVLRGARESLPRVDRVVLEYHSKDLRAAVVDLLGRSGFIVVLDDRMYFEDVGLLFARRVGGESGRSRAATV